MVTRWTLRHKKRLHGMLHFDPPSLLAYNVYLSKKRARGPHLLDGTLEILNGASSLVDAFAHRLRLEHRVDRVSRYYRGEVRRKGSEIT